MPTQELNKHPVNGSVAKAVKRCSDDSYAQGYYHGVMDASAGVHDEKLRKKGEHVDKK